MAAWRCLDERENQDEKVTLLWDPDRNRIALRVLAKSPGLETFAALIPNEKARDAFNHPHCYGPIHR